MTAVEGTAVTGKSNPTFGVFALVMGLIAVAGVTAIWLVSAAPNFDMPGWLRIVSGWSIPVGVLGAIALGVLARARRSGVALSTIGFALAAAAVIEFGVMIAMNPY